MSDGAGVLLLLAIIAVGSLFLWSLRSEAETYDYPWCNWEPEGNGVLEGRLVRAFGFTTGEQADSWTEHMEARGWTVHGEPTGFGWRLTATCHTSGGDD